MVCATDGVVLKQMQRGQQYCCHSAVYTGIHVFSNLKGSMHLAYIISSIHWVWRVRTECFPSGMTGLIKHTMWSSHLIVNLLCTNYNTLSETEARSVLSTESTITPFMPVCTCMWWIHAACTVHHTLCIINQWHNLKSLQATKFSRYTNWNCKINQGNY